MAGRPGSASGSLGGAVRGGDICRRGGKGILQAAESSSGFKDISGRVTFQGVTGLSLRGPRGQSLGGHQRAFDRLPTAHGWLPGRNVVG